MSGCPLTRCAELFEFIDWRMLDDESDRLPTRRLAVTRILAREVGAGEFEADASSRMWVNKKDAFLVMPGRILTQDVCQMMPWTGNLPVPQFGVHRRSSAHQIDPVSVFELMLFVSLMMKGLGS